MSNKHIEPVQIIPAVMPHHYEDLGEHLNRVTGLVDMVQIDIMDGHFVKGTTWPYKSGTVTPDEHFEHILHEDEGLPSWQEFDFEIDLMVNKPENIWQQWVSAGARRIVIHQESTEKMAEIIAEFREQFPKQDEHGLFDVELGIAQNITTPIETLAPFLDDVDFVQLMGIAEIGKQGEPFDERVLPKIEALRQVAPHVVISVDGGVSHESARALILAGVNRLVVGSALFESEDLVDSLEVFKHLARE